MRCQTFLLTLLAAFVLSLVSVPARLMAEKDYPNVLFIMVDDLRPERGCYGQGTSRPHLPLPEQLPSKSLKPLLDNPTFAWTDSVYCRFINGDTVASKDFSYTRWTGKNGHTYGRMLYDHRTDPDENNNVVGEKKYEKVVERLDQQLGAMIEQTTD